MYLKLLLLLNLIGFVLIASQPLFYMLALADSQKKLAAPAYIELRKLLDKKLKVRLKLLYYGTLLSAVLVMWFAFAAEAPLQIVTACIALLALVVDIFIAVKRNVPINKIIDNWEVTKYPRHWQLVRRKWIYFYAFRQVVGIIGFLSLLIGIVFK